jgi:AraC-like DNA-binding protein
VWASAEERGMDDVLSDVLRLVRVKSCVYFIQEFRAPWGMAIGGTGFAQFHAVVRGDCIAEAGGRHHLAEAGDVMLFPRGADHVLADEAGRAAKPGMAVLQAIREDRPLFAEGGRATKLICGHYEYAGDARHPLIEQLPDFIHVRGFDQISAETLESVIPLLVRELGNRGPGTDTVVERLAEVLLIQVLRAHLAACRPGVGFLAAAGDPRLSRAIRLVHEAHDRPLTLEQLADEAGMSRSAFAERFKAVARLSPISYLTRWRLERARQLLSAGGVSVAQVAGMVGYESDVAFSRAFKREYAVSPAAYRGQSA